MHRHAYSTRKISRTAGPRRALLRGLLDSLILYERIELPVTRAKELAPYFERQVTHAKQQNLHAYRQILAETINPVAAQKLFYDLVNGFQSRNSGYTRIIKTATRLGDGAPMAVIELVLDENYQKPAAKKDEKSKQATKKPAKKPVQKASKEEVKTKITSSKKTKAAK